MNILARAAICIFFLQIAGCMTLPEITERIKISNMKGKPIAVATAHLGQPTNTYDTTSGRVYVWNSYRENVRRELVGNTTVAGPNGLITYQELGNVTYRYKCLIRIIVDPTTQVIADYSVEGNNCRSW